MNGLKNDLEHGGYEFASIVTGIKVNTLYSLVHSKRIPHFRINRRFVQFSRKDLMKWLDSFKVIPSSKARRAK